MTSQRALYVLAHATEWGELRFAFEFPWGEKHRVTIHADGITPREHFFIKTCWQTMSGDASYYDAVSKIAMGEYK